MTSYPFDFSDKDVLTPQIQELDGMFFRINPVFSTTDEKSSKSVQQYGEDSSALVADFSSEELDVLYNRLIPPRKNDAFRLVLDKEHIPAILYPMLIGKNGQTKKAIEDETKARFYIPEKKNQTQDKPIEIISYDEVQLVICRRRLLQAAQNARMRIAFTHFLCFPVQNERIQKSFHSFREEVTARCASSRGFSDDLFQDPKKLHLTIGTLALFTPREYGLAGDDITECFMEKGFWRILSDGPLKCRLKGLEIMNDDPSEVDVLYANIDDPSGRIQKITDKLHRHFLKAEPRFLQDRFEDRDGVKLHVTLMNTRFRKEAQYGEVEEEEGKKVRKTFDASAILKHFKDFDFGDCVISHIHLSQRYTTAQDGFYKPTKVVPLDSSMFRNSAPTEDFVEDSGNNNAAVRNVEYGDEPSCDTEW